MTHSRRQAKRSQLNLRANQTTNDLQQTIMDKLRTRQTIIVLTIIVILLIKAMNCQTTSEPPLEVTNNSIASTPSVELDLTSATITESTTTSNGELQQPQSEPINISGNNTNKLRGVNFTQVNELFEAVLSEEEVAKRWKNMDAQIQDGIRSILKMLFPQIVAMSQDAKVSGECSGGILKWILSLRNLRSWAIKSK